MIDTVSRRWLTALGGVVVVVIGILLVLVVLPRVLGGGYTALTAESPIASHQDGIQIVASPQQLDGSFRVKLDAIPQLSFLEGSAGDALRRAAESLPPNLVVKSPYYQLTARGQAPDSTLIAVDIPNNAEPWETLDLYSWTGDSWRWVGGRIDTTRGLILAEVGHNIPSSVVLMQAGPTPPAIATALGATESSTTAVNDPITHLLLVGLSLGDVAGITGDFTQLPVPSAGDDYAVMPSIRNWSEEKVSSGWQVGAPNQASLADVLANASARQTHIDNIVALVTGQGYAGIDLDYRGVVSEWRDDYTALVTDLANILHAQGKVLSIVVEFPSPDAEGEWDTGGYDWRALGQMADLVRVPFPVDINDRGVSGEEYLTWALGEVSRYKLLPMLAAHSTDAAADQITYVSTEAALAPLGQITGPENTLVSPDETVRFELGGEALDTFRQDANTQTHTYFYQDDAGVTHNVTVVTPASLATILNSAQRFHLGGVFVDGLLDTTSTPALTAILQQFANRTPVASSDTLQIVWTVETTSGGQLQRESTRLDESHSFEWTAPESAGEYVISAAIIAGDHEPSAVRNDIAITVATPEPEQETSIAAAAVLTETIDLEAEQPPTEAVTADCLNATYVADVTVSDNTRFEKSESFVKTWRVRNSGSCPWPSDTQITFVSGNALNGAQSVQVGELEAGGTTDISIDMAAPDADGNYKGVWRLAAGNESFGTRLTVVIRVGEEATAPPPSAPPPSGGGSFELGGHVRTWNYVSQMKNAGMSWAKVQMHFGQDASGLVQTAHNLGLKIQLSALGSADMVTQPNFHADYTAWVASMAATGADAIEVWNEPNIDREWQIGQISPAAYTQLLCASYSAIKAANSNTAVISAAPAPTGFFGGCSGNGCDDLPWLQGMYNAGAANCMDYIGAHHNSGATAPSARSGHPADSGDHHHSWYFLPQTELYYNIFGGTRKLFYTEMGYASQEGVPAFSDQFAWARGTNNAQQAAWLAEAVRLSRSTGMVRCIVVWNIDFSRYGYDPQDGYAIIRPDGSCPACETLRAAMQ